MEKAESCMEKASNNFKKNPAKYIIHQLAEAAGITINGAQPWDIQVHNENAYVRILREGSLGLGESYVDKWWDCQQLDVFFFKILRANVDAKVNVPLHFKLKQLFAAIINFQTKARAREVAYKHYDLGNDLFTAMLDSRMIYSCAYWKDADSLDAAQEAKLDLICKKLELKPGMSLLDIGCGWGGLAKYAAEKYGARVVGVTISEEQYNYAKENCKNLPIEIRLQDYRDLNQQFDRVVSVGMFEHVGHLNYRTFMQVAHNSLADDGLFLLHTIGGNETALFADDWITTYIFPNGMVPSGTLIDKATEKLFVMEDWQNFGAYYDNTLMAWHKNFDQRWGELKARYDDRFYRLWSYYLLSCAGGFRARTSQLWQIVYSKKGKLGGYQSPR